MTANENPVLMFLAFVFLAIAIFCVLKYYKEIAFSFLILIGGGVTLIALGLIVYGATLIYDIVHEENVAKQCLTAHERRARALAAPDDYFGRQFRAEAVQEAKLCAEIAAKREAAAKH